MRSEKNFAQTPFPGAQDGQNLISWRWSLPTQFGEDLCTQFRIIVVTDPQTHTPTNIHTNKQTHRQERLQYTSLQLARSVTNGFVAIAKFVTHTACTKQSTSEAHVKYF